MTKPVREKLTIAQYEEAIRKSGGFLTEVAKMLGVTHQAVTNRIKKSERLQIARHAVEEKYKDLAESKLIQAINNNEAWAICFYLKCKAKDRGYIERTEIGGKLDDMTLTVKVVQFGSHDPK